MGSGHCVVFVFCAATALGSPAQTFKTVASFDLTNGDALNRLSSKVSTGTSAGRQLPWAGPTALPAVAAAPSSNDPEGQSDHALQLLLANELWQLSIHGTISSHDRRKSQDSKRDCHPVQ